MSRAQKEAAAKKTRGFILTDQYGGKGVICRVIPAKHVPQRRPYNNLSMRKKYAYKNMELNRHPSLDRSIDCVITPLLGVKCI